jgi:hypothetical protein
VTALNDELSLPHFVTERHYNNIIVRGRDTKNDSKNELLIKKALGVGNDN